MFEVGKRYRHSNGYIFECMAISDGYGWMKAVEFEGMPSTYEFNRNWSEYKEPRTITRWVNVYKDRYGDLSFGHMYEDETKARANGHCNGAIATIPITYTEPH